MSRGMLASFGLEMREKGYVQKPCIFKTGKVQVEKNLDCDVQRLGGYGPRPLVKCDVEEEEGGVGGIS